MGPTETEQLGQPAFNLIEDGMYICSLFLFKLCWVICDE